MDAIERIFQYHEETKHRFDRYARGPGYMDWATQPDPFRRYEGSRLIRLELIPDVEGPLYEPPFFEDRVPVQPINFKTMSRLFHDSLALSAWKQAGGVRWALRVNPSSGNLHPTEGYLLCGPMEGLGPEPVVCHYAPRAHALEERAGVPAEVWEKLSAEWAGNVLFVGLTSIYWREAWKYGERAFRYCHHDVGHAVAAVSLAAAGLGWKATLLDGLATGQLENLLGTFDPRGAEPEHPDCLLAVHPQGKRTPEFGIAPEVTEAFRKIHWIGKPNQLSSGHVEWPLIDTASEAVRKPETPLAERDLPISRNPVEIGAAPIFYRKIIHRRRSAVALDGRTGIQADAFYQILLKASHGAGQFPFNALPWAPRIHLAVFVFRVQDVEPGLYLLVRNRGHEPALRALLKKEFAWEKPGNCPDGLELYRLLTGDARDAARTISCHQEIAADGCFSLGMIAEFEEPLNRFGAWFYPRLFWEAGMIGQVLYLEAEAHGIRGTGIGCFFDDPMHDLLGIAGRSFQDLYHFTMGGPLEDERLLTSPPYPSDVRLSAD
jgi:SagB-type dehydrogenase family enzyme